MDPAFIGGASPFFSSDCLCGGWAFCRRLFSPRGEKGQLFFFFFPKNRLFSGSVSFGLLSAVSLPSGFGRFDRRGQGRGVEDRQFLSHPGCGEKDLGPPMPFFRRKAFPFEACLGCSPFLFFSCSFFSVSSCRGLKNSRNRPLFFFNLMGCLGGISISHRHLFVAPRWSPFSVTLTILPLNDCFSQFSPRWARIQLRFEPPRARH